MKFGSVCSGIEAASVAWNPLGWQAQWFAEIEPFPCALLKHHYPETPNLGDMTKFNEWPTDDKYAIDLLCGGTPCQSFSVAGLRKGLDDPRGNLMLTFGAIAAKYRPQWLVWENVPGVLSSNGGADFGAFLGMLGQLGYGFAYRVLDAQYFGVAQRRRRVFVVGCLGDWRSAAAVLFERHSLQGHPAPSRQAGKAAPTIPSRSTAGGGLGTDFDLDGVLIPQRARALTTSNQRIDAETETFIVQPSTAYRTAGDGAVFEEGDRTAPLTTGTDPCANILAFDTTQVTSVANRSNPKAGDPCHPLAAGMHAPAIAYQTQGVGYGRMDGGTPQGANDLPARAMRDMCSTGGGSTSQKHGLEGSSAGELAAPVPQLPHEGAQVRSEMHAVRQAAQGLGLLRDALPAIQEMGRPDGDKGQPVHTHSQGGRTTPAEGMQGSGLHGEVSREGVLQQARPAGQQGNTGCADCQPQRKSEAAMARGALQVRRLLPIECERLQGFPDNYTAIPHRNKPAADGPRYKALGNSWAVPNVRWIGERIEAVALVNSEQQAIKVRAA